LAKTKQKSRSESEHFRGILKEYEKEIRSLRQQLRQYEKYDRSQDEESSSDSEDTQVQLLMTKDCTCCGKGKVIETLQIMGKTYGTCNMCDYKERLK
jgi:hypothetical protein